jgi:hypothetical protein
MDVFADLKEKIHPTYREILLTNSAGIPPFREDDGAEFRSVQASQQISGSPVEQRRALLVLQRKPTGAAPGTKTE